ncbi:dehydrodolichyl diphosphate synthase 2-like [Panicum miliaceum]|uniref:Alkyl transferase n=1 Tax=Panicum miliaceum TaxID=4540 RepID=A0A3L6RFU6_PANMI|nr:dehydrodolichyl diphosphate synthase 2-like [Panicum miliaceum]
MADTDLPQALVHRGLRKELMPQHVAFVMDGNRRWAQAQGLTTAEGHEAGGRALEKILQLSVAWGIRAITEEVDCVMELIERAIRDKMEEYTRDGIRLHVIGDPSTRPASLQEAVREAEEKTRNNSRFHMILATCYSGRWDIVQACRELAAKVQDKLLDPEDIDEAMLAGHLSTNVLGEFACPDLLIRTSGELRLSNFLLWQSAYTELYFSNRMWPDFDEDEYLEALKDFQRRERRFGQRKPSSQESN